MTTLDSRMLTYLNTFGCSFREPGEVRYRLVSGVLACAPSEDELIFSIAVRDGAGGNQHHVTVRRDGHQLVADPAELTISAGDLVMWHSTASTPAYAVQGVGGRKGGGFDSTALADEMVFTHAFGLPGEYEWVDARRGSVSGVVRVGTLDGAGPDGCRKWRAALGEGTVVVIDGDRAVPAKVDVLAGQTVFFAVSAGEGITITERALVAG